MAKLKVFRTLIGFSELEKFYGETISGAYSQIENFERSYCNCCGKVTSTLNDMCDCGTTKFIKIGPIDYYTYRDSILDDKVTSVYDAKTDELTISAELLKINRANREDLEIFVETKKIISLRKNDYTVFDKDLLRYVKPNHLDAYPYKQDILNYSCLFTYRCVPEETLTLNTLMNVVNAFKMCPNFLEDPDTMRFKYLANYLIKNVNLAPAYNKSFVNLITSFKVNPEHFEILDKYCKNNSYYGAEYEVLSGISSGYYYRSSSTPRITYSEFLENQDRLYRTMPNHIWGALYHHLCSGAINLDDFCIILNQYNDLFNYDKTTFLSRREITYFNYNHDLRNTKNFCNFWEKSFLKLFSVYLKENLYGKPTRNLVVSFVEDLYLMRKYSIPIDEDSLKLKNFNYNLNERNLAEHLGLSPDKVEVFLDTFDRNPLASVSLLKDRRKLTKKQMDEYMELLDKEA